MTHFTACLDFIILIDRMKNFSSYVKKVFTISAKKITAIVFCICVCVDLFLVFEYAPFENDYYFYSPNGKLNTYKVYVSLSSTIASSHVGSILAIVVFVIKDGVTLLVSITLNLISFIQMRKHSAKKKLLGALHLQTTTTSQMPQNERQRIYERNMFWMIITVCFNSCLVKTTTFACNIYWLFQYNLFAYIIGVVADIFIALNSTLPFLIYLRFNRKFRNILSNKIFRGSGADSQNL